MSGVLSEPVTQANAWRLDAGPSEADWRLWEEARAEGRGRIKLRKSPVLHTPDQTFAIGPFDLQRFADTPRGPHAEEVRLRLRVVELEDEVSRLKAERAELRTRQVYADVGEHSALAPNVGG